MSSYSFTGTFTDAELHQTAFALQCHFGADDPDDVDLTEVDGTAGIDAWKSILFMEPEPHGADERQITFTQDQVDEITEALHSHIADTEDLNETDVREARSALSKLELTI